MKLIKRITAMAVYTLVICVVSVPCVFADPLTTTTTVTAQILASSVDIVLVVLFAIAFVGWGKCIRQYSHLKEELCLIKLQEQLKNPSTTRPTTTSGYSYEQSSVQDYAQSPVQDYAQGSAQDYAQGSAQDYAQGSAQDYTQNVYEQNGYPQNGHEQGLAQDYVSSHDHGYEQNQDNYAQTMYRPIVRPTCNPKYQAMHTQGQSGVNTSAVVENYAYEEEFSAPRSNAERMSQNSGNLSDDFLNCEQSVTGMHYKDKVPVGPTLDPTDLLLRLRQNFPQYLSDLTSFSACISGATIRDPQDLNVLTSRLGYFEDDKSVLPAV